MVVTKSFSQFLLFILFQIFILSCVLAAGLVFIFIGVKNVVCDGWLRIKGITYDDAGDGR